MSGRTVLLLLVVATLGACALTRANGDAAETAAATEVANVARRIVQLGFGRQAHFGECVEPDCPAKTRKSLPASPEPIPAQLTTPTATTVPAPVPVSLAPAIPAATPATSPESRRLILHFALDSASLTAAHKLLLRDALPGLRLTDRIVIAGRTDDLGSVPLNQSLALARGLAVRDYLLSLDAALPARISIDARGRCCYAVANDDAQARAQNRRVEITYSPGSGVAP